MKYILGLLSLIAALAGVFLKGRQTGKVEEQNKQLKLDLDAEQKKSETLQTATDVAASVGAMPASDVQQRLRDKYSRD